MLNAAAKQIRHRLAPFGLCLLALASTVHATLIQSTWQGGTSGSWSNASNWLPSTGYPQNAADTYEATISGASVALSENITVNTLNLNDGDLNGAHSLTVSPSGGLAFDGLNSLTLGLTLNITGPISFADSAAALTNHGSLIFKVSGAGNYTASNATLTNAPSGTLGFDSANGISIGATGLLPFRIINEGNLLADNSASNYIFAPVTNSGTVRATADSSLYLATASSLGGTLQADSGSAIYLYGYGGQTHTLTQLDITGSGSVSTNSTKLTGSLKSGTLTANNTTLTGGFTVESAATLAWGDQNAFSANTDSLTNHGAIRFTSDDTSFPTASTASLVNASNGTVSFAANAYIGDSDTSPFSLINQGNLLADNGSSNYVFAPVTNSGTVHATADSSLYLATASTLGGTLQADSGSAIYLYGYGGQTHTLTQLDITGSGSVSTDSTKLTGSLKSGTLSANNTTLTATFTVESAATLAWGDQNAFSANTDSLTNHGTIRFTAGDTGFPTASTAALVNASNGTVSFAANAYIGDDDTSPFLLINQGSLLADNGSSNYVFAPVTNSGTVRATANSSLYLSTASSLGGTLQADSGSAIYLYGYGGQTHTLNQLAITGSGSVSTASTKLTGSLKSGTLTANNTTLTGGFGLETAATFVWGDQNAFSANTDSLTNHGTILFTSGDTGFATTSTASLINAFDGILAFDTDSSIGDADTAPFLLGNYGTLITADTTTNYLYTPTTNFGNLRVTTGSTLNIGASFTQNSGETYVANANLTALSGLTLYFNGGTLRATGTITAPLNLASTALELGPGQTAGSLGITGNLAFQAGSSLRTDLNGTTAGSGYDKVTVTGAVTLGGDLVVRLSPAFRSTIQSTDTFNVLTATSITGAFANVISGQRAKLPSGLGSCLLTVSSTKVTLSNFTSSTLDAYLATAGVPVDQRDHAADPDGDGLSNLLEYALNLNPMASDTSGLPVLARVGNTLTLTYKKVRNDVGYEVITTTELGNPGSWTTSGVTQGTPNGNGMTTASVPLSGAKTFLRLRVNYAP